MPDITLTAGTLDFEDTGAPFDGAPVLVFVHGLVMNGSLWRHVVADLRGEARCIVPTLPLGGHRRPMREGADLSLRGQARLLAELLERLELHDVTLVFNDFNCAPPLIQEGLDARVGRLVLSSCETVDNYPPGLPGSVAALAARVPGGINAAMQPLRLRPLRRGPMTFGWMSKRPVPDAVMDDWLAPVLADKAIRRDLRAYARGTAAGRQTLQDADASLRDFAKPVLVVWAAEDRVMPVASGRRLAGSFPDSRFVEITDSYTLLPEDQPGPLARHLRTFVQETT